MKKYLIFLILLLISCSKSSFLSFNIDLSKYKYVKLNKKIIDEKVKIELSNVLHNLKKEKHYILDKPDIIIEYYNENENINYLSIYLKEKFIFDKYFLDGMTERLHDKKSKCYNLNSKSYKYLKRIYKETL